uniref:Uncharacterized protein n=1 Tax=Arundo donax TaxID=35708 RepID=A0A0A8YCF7_ARUDO
MLSAIQPTHSISYWTTLLRFDAHVLLLYNVN